MRLPPGSYVLPVHCAGLGEYISGSILFEETLYDKAATGESFVELMKKQGIIPGIKTDKARNINPSPACCYIWCCMFVDWMLAVRALSPGCRHLCACWACLLLLLCFIRILYALFHAGSCAAVQLQQ